MTAYALQVVGYEGQRWEPDGPHAVDLDTPIYVVSWDPDADAPGGSKGLLAISTDAPTLTFATEADAQAYLDTLPNDHMVEVVRQQ